MPDPRDTNVISFSAARSRRRASTGGTRPRGSAAVQHAEALPPSPAWPPGAPLLSLVESWELALDSANKSKRTIRAYTDSVRALARWLDSRGYPTDAENVTAEHLRMFLRSEKERTSAASAGSHHRNLRVFWKWVITEGERTHTASPMTNVEAVKSPKKAKSFFDDEQLAALLKTCAGNSFEDRRDTAIMRIFIDTGVRVGGLVSIRYTPDNPETNGVDLKNRRLRVVLKGGDEHIIPLGKKAAQAVDRYLRARARHPKAALSPFLFLGVRGRKPEYMTPSGVHSMIVRRGKQAGVPDAHPHRFRRTFADDYLENGGTLDGVMAVAGWKSLDMVREYAGDRAMERARQMHDRLSPGDRI
ncbi:tyrosine-type recombinase/integrase [Actinomadura gamaensis]|uniref:Tyrosine-type recombinase/integrase n=1 Tax=Actinomadura gamaensis TaxID=1763541 RepID=A0ABV9U7M4_9ACTN